MTQTFRHFFIVGCRRSGTTLLRLVLRAHPAIHVPGEGDYLMQCWEMFKGKPDALEKMRDFLTNDFAFRNTKLPPPSEAKTAGLDLKEALMQLTEELLCDEAVDASKSLRGLQIHDHFHYLVELFPDARFIFIRRDPHDVTDSMCKLGWYGNTWEAAEQWERSELDYLRLKSALGPQFQTQCLELRFETLVTSPESVLQSILTHLEVDSAPGILDRFYRGTTYGPIDAKEAYKWMHKNRNNGKRDLIGLRFGDRIRDCGYEILSPPIAPGLLRTLLTKYYHQQHRVRRLYSNIRIYGLPLTAIQIMLRFFPIPALKTRTANARYVLWRKTLK